MCERKKYEWSHRQICPKPTLSTKHKRTTELLVCLSSLPSVILLVENGVLETSIPDKNKQIKEYIFSQIET